MGVPQIFAWFERGIQRGSEIRCYKMLRVEEPAGFPSAEASYEQSSPERSFTEAKSKSSSVNWQR